MKYAEAYRHREADVILFEIEDSVPFADKDLVRAHLLEVLVEVSLESIKRLESNSFSQYSADCPCSTHLPGAGPGQLRAAPA